MDYAFLQLIIVQLLVDAGIQYAFNKLISEVCKHCKKTYWPVKKDITDLGVCRLLQMPETCQRRQMIIEIVKRFESSNQSFRICGHDIQIQLVEDVKDIMGLPIEGKNVFSHKGPKGNKIECNKISFSGLPKEKTKCR